jgi:hypothetical protein
MVSPGAEQFIGQQNFACAAAHLAAESLQNTASGNRRPRVDLRRRTGSVSLIRPDFDESHLHTPVFSLRGGVVRGDEKAA